MAKREIQKVTTIEMDALDVQRVEMIQNYLKADFGGVPMRAAITWALKVACEKIDDGKAC